MLKAILTYLRKDTNQSVTLDSGSLFYIDEITKKYNNLDSLKASYGYNSDDDKIKLYFIKDMNQKEELPILVNDKMPIQVYNDFYNNIESEIEKSRKLLFNSKNKMFLKSFLEKDNLVETLNFSVNISFEENKNCIKNGLSTYETNGNYYLRVLDLFNYISNSTNYGKMRNIFEDSLDLWKRRITSLDTDKIYYYSRNLRILKNDYYKMVRGIVNIKNLNVNNIELLKPNDELINVNSYVKLKKEA